MLINSHYLHMCIYYYKFIYVIDLLIISHLVKHNMMAGVLEGIFFTRFRGTPLNTFPGRKPDHD